MSRCFPYPPPGYSLSRASNEALIESIKLQNEREKSNEKRKKEKRREKKGKRKEKKEKRKEKKNQDSGKSRNVDNVRVEENIWVDSKSKHLFKGRNGEIEQLERSSITEEHEQPLCSRIPSSSSDSTENSNKRSRHTSSIDGSNGLGTGNIIKIRLPSKKKIEPDTSFHKPQLCSTSGTMDFPAQRKDEIAVRAIQCNVYPNSQGTHKLVQEFPTRTDQELVFSASRQMESAAQGKLGTSSGANAVLTPTKKLELKYKNLIEKWVLPKLHTVAANDPNDQEWLFQRKDNDVHAEKRFRSSGDAISCPTSTTLWPQSRYLPEADIYALPFLIPF